MQWPAFFDNALIENDLKHVTAWDCNGMDLWIFEHYYSVDRQRRSRFTDFEICEPQNVDEQPQAGVSGTQDCPTQVRGAPSEDQLQICSCLQLQTASQLPVLVSVQRLK